MKTNKIFYNRNLRNALLILTGLFFGWLFFHNPKPERAASGEVHDHTSEKKGEIWTCSMHPQIRMDKPGQCPICGMDLIPLTNSKSEIDDQALQMSESAMKLAEVQTTVVTAGNASKEVRLYGKIQPDERLLITQSAHVPGRIEQLMVNVTGESVRKGQLIARIYSPELITAQKELKEASSIADEYPAVLVAAREKLRLWKLTDQQIADIEKSGEVKNVFDLYATRTGIIANRLVSAGDYVNQGQVLFEMADLSRVWAVFDAYESDLAWISLGQNVEFTAQAIPGKTFNGKISFIDPVVDPSTRITKVRVEATNPGSQFKPEMFINGIVQSGQKNTGNQLVIPQSAVLWTGTRSVVYVKFPGTEHPTFKMREVTLGNSMANSYIILDGLKSGEEVVTNGTFSIDAAAQLEGKPSMMNTAGGETSTGHDHGAMESKETKAKEESTASYVNKDFAKQLNPVLDKYIGLKNALVQSDVKKAKQAAGEFQQQLAKVNMGLLKGDSHSKWMDLSDNIQKHVKKISAADNTEDQRSAFSGLSDLLYRTIKTFGLDEKTYYYQFCPMAFDNKGAYWLSETKAIKNPYFGEKMMDCGETKETLNN